MNTAMLLLVMILAAYRLTRLVVKDQFPPLLWVRHKLAGGWAGPAQDVPVHRARWSPQWLADLVTCSWCASAWVSLGVLGCTATVVAIPLPVLTWLAVWAGAALLASQDWA
ncbi:DUF1360 domain-containing protein [Streptomyces sp. NPDC050658]|uniref:DUF1360 domain-containing protein n=1 Tax=unclassified Streptomyces TaxID=2593676 RepID=UPI0034125B0C